MRHVALFCSLVLLSGCATRPLTYVPPDQTKVVESTRKIKEGIKKSRATAAEAKALVEQSQKSADKISVLSLTLSGKIEDLIKIAPEELKLPLEAAKSDLGAMQLEEESLKTGLGNAWTKQGEVEQHLVATDTRVAELEQQQAAYHAEAQALAGKATDERNYRIAAEKQLSTQRWFGWIFKLGALLLLGIVALFFLLKWLGKLGWAAGKIGIKAAI